MDDLISKQAVLKIIDGWYENNRDIENIEDLIILITYMASIKPQAQEPCSDAISRSEAIRVASGYCHWTNIPAELAKLPSVTPKHCEDAISRVAAIDKLDEWDWQELYLPIHFKELLDELPSVSTEKTGRWITYELFQSGIKETWYECPKCKWSNALGIPRNYCPNCGAKMQEETETCKDCTNKCIMYEPNMKGCKDKMVEPQESEAKYADSD